MAEALKSVRELSQATTAFFEKRGLDSARLNAERLLGHVLGLARLDLYLNHDRLLTADEIDRYRDLVRQRAAGVPLQTLLGETEFYGRPFRVEPGVFIPRPETERLVEAAVQLLTGGASSWLSPLALEIGCGTGVVACSLAMEIPRLRVHASDVNPRAAALTLANARRLGVAARVDVHEGAGCEPFPPQLRGHAHLLVSNPPYVRRGDLAGLPIEVAEHDPVAALDGGPDGLSAYREIAQEAPAWLMPGGWIALEIGEDQAADVTGLLRDAGFSSLIVKRDYCDRDRVVTGRL